MGTCRPVEDEEEEDSEDDDAEEKEKETPAEPQINRVNMTPD